MEVQSSVPKDVPYLSIITVLSNRTLFSKPSLTLIILVVLSSKELSPRESNVISGVRKCLLNSVFHPRGGGTRDLQTIH